MNTADTVDTEDTVDMNTADMGDTEDMVDMPMVVTTSLHFNGMKWQ